MATAIKTRRTLLASAARTATTACPVQKDAVEQFLRVYLNVTAASGTGGLTVVIRGYDLASGVAGNISVGNGAVTATGMYLYELSSSQQAASANVKETISRLLPCVWDVQVQAGDASSYTYTLGCEVFPG